MKIVKSGLPRGILLTVLFVSIISIVHAQQSEFQGIWLEEKNEYFDITAYRIEITENRWQEFYDNQIEAAGTIRFSTGRAELLLADGRVARDLRLLAPGLVEQPISMWDGYYRFKHVQSSSNSQSNTQDTIISPMYGLEFDSQSVTLNGRVFEQNQYAESWREQEGFALVDGIRRHYWLYDSYSYYDGSAGIVFNRILPSWIEDLGYFIDFDNLIVSNPNPDVASSVKTLMTQRGCDIGITLIYDTSARRNTLVVNNFNRSKGIYDIKSYHLFK